MDFGKASDLSAADISLPPDHPDTTANLPGRPAAVQEIRLGCAKWGRTDWVGTIYPEGTKESEFLDHYGQHFDAIELNASHYRVPKPEWIEKWCKQVPETFRFSPKIHRNISHKALEFSEFAEFFFDRLQLFGSFLGRSFLQMPPYFSPKKLPELERFLEAAPESIPLSLELRNKGWFEDEEAGNKVFAMMKDRGIVPVITDVLGRRDVCHQRLVSPEVFIRFMGNNLDPTDYLRIDAWVDRIKHWLDNGLERVWFYMHQDEEVNSPKLAAYAVGKIAEVTGIQLKSPNIIGSE